MFLLRNFTFFPDNPYYQERFYGVEIRFWRFTDGLEGVFALGDGASGWFLTLLAGFRAPAVDVRRRRTCAAGWTVA